MEERVTDSYWSPPESLAPCRSPDPGRNPFGDVSTSAYVHLWEAHDKVVVSDIDGTITKSDVIGYIDTVQLGT